MNNYEIYIHVIRERKDTLVFRCDSYEQALAFVFNTTHYFEPFKQNFHEDEDKGRYHIVKNGKVLYRTKWYEIPR